MNSSMGTADAATHLKIVATALLAASVVVWVGLTARTSTMPRWETAVSVASDHHGNSKAAKERAMEPEMAM